jgi:hypothetical protein
MAVRQMAIVHLAMFDAANGLDPKYLSYLVTNGAPGSARSKPALRLPRITCLRTLFPKSADVLDSHYNAILAAIPNSTAKTNGLQWGRHVANEYLKLRQFDGAGQSAGYSYKDSTGYWKRTPRTMTNRCSRHGSHEALCDQVAEDFNVAPPRRSPVQIGQSQYNYLKTIGATNSTVRTPSTAGELRFFGQTVRAPRHRPDIGTNCAATRP